MRLLPRYFVTQFERFFFGWKRGYYLRIGPILFIRVSKWCESGFYCISPTFNIFSTSRCNTNEKKKLFFYDGDLEMI